MVSERIVCRRFVGRAAEIEHLLARRRSAVDEHGGLVLIGGEAGIGKSRLVHEYRRRLENSAIVFAATACREFAQRPLAPLAAVFKQLEGGAQDPFARPSASKDQLLDAVVEAFERLTERRTIFIVIEDLHWAGLELVQILSVLAEEAAHRRLLFIGTYRTDEVGPHSPIFNPFANLIHKPAVSLLQLRPFSGLELSELIDGCMDPTIALPAAALGDVRSRCGGNPLFAEELLRNVVDQHRTGTDWTDPSVPISLQGVIRQRLARCTPADRALLSAASALGRRFKIDVLAETFGFPIDDQLAALRRLRDLQLVDPSADEPLTYAFRHALTRDVIYGEMLPLERKRLHSQVAETVAERSDAGEYAELLAHSFWEAGLFAKAAPHCESAGDSAHGLYAHADAAVWYERAAAGFAGRDADVGRTLGKAVFALANADAVERALTMFTGALAAYERLGDVAAIVTLSIIIGSALNNGGRSPEGFAVMRKALEHVPVTDSELRHHILIRMAALRAAHRSIEEGWHVLAEIDEQALDPISRFTAEYYVAKGSLHAQRFERDAWLACFNRSLELFERTATNDVPGNNRLRYVHGSGAVTASGLGEMALARKHQLISLEFARKIKIDEAYGLAVLAEIERLAGNLDAAAKLLAQIDPVRTFLARYERAMAGTLLGVAAGDRAVIEQFLDLSLIAEAERGGATYGVAQSACVCAQGLLVLGRHEEADALLLRAIGALEALGAPFALATQIAALLALRPGWAERLRPIVGRFGEPSDGVNGALCTLVKATIAANEGDAVRARAFAAAAADGFKVIGWPLLEAQCREVAGDERRALALYRAAGASGELRRMEQRQISRGDAPPGSVLTRREREVAELIASGKDNRAVADALSVSKKTVEKYLTSIYLKLGLTSRAQLAAFMVSADGRTTRQPDVAALNKERA